MRVVAASKVVKSGYWKSARNGSISLNLIVAYVLQELRVRVFNQ